MSYTTRLANWRTPQIHTTTEKLNQSLTHLCSNMATWLRSSGALDDGLEGGNRVMTGEEGTIAGTVRGGTFDITDSVPEKVTGKTAASTDVS